jgi:hypothetical protein
MITQARWVEILMPMHWSLKFRIPYPIVAKGEKYPYLEGTLWRQPYTKIKSMEMRLIGTWRDSLRGIRAQEYDTRELEEQMFYHNSIIRPNKIRYLNIYSLDAREYASDMYNRGYDATYVLYVMDCYLKSEFSMWKYMLGEKENSEYINTILSWVMSTPCSK